MSDAVSYLREESSDLAASIGRTVSSNPVPIALLGIGAGWLLFSALRPQNGGGYAEDRDYSEGAGGSADATEGELAEWSRGAADQASAARAEARERLSRVGAAARERAERLRRAAETRTARYRRSVGEMMDEQPLLIGAAGLVMGALIGAALPRTRYEDEWLGETRDDLRDRAEDFAREQWERGERVVERAAEAAREEAERQGFTVEHVREGAKAVASAAETAAEEEAGIRSASDAPSSSPS